MKRLKGTVNKPRCRTLREIAEENDIPIGELYDNIRVVVALDGVNRELSIGQLKDFYLKHTLADKKQEQKLITQAKVNLRKALNQLDVLKETI